MNHTARGRRTFPLRRITIPLMISLILVASSFSVASAATHLSAPSIVGPKKMYLSLGNSVAYGYQPDLNFDDGYSDDFYQNLKGYGEQSLVNLACPGETSTTFIHGGCPAAFLHKVPYLGSQLNAATTFLKLFPGQVSPVTLDIGANDVNGDINVSTCVYDQAKFESDLATLDANLTQVILPQLRQAMTVNSQMSGDLLIMNYYDPYQNRCPGSLPYAQELNQHLAQDIQGYARLVDVFNAFGGSTTPNPHLCSYTWICSIFKDIHPKDLGYSVIAQAFENTVGY